jgi:ribosome-binding factor A
LCKQVGRVVQQTLLACGDDVLIQLQVRSVAPGGSGRLIVTVCCQGADPAAIRDRLERASGYLRCEVAAALNRRKVPELVYRVELAD